MNRISGWDIEHKCRIFYEGINKNVDIRFRLTKQIIIFVSCILCKVNLFSSHIHILKCEHNDCIMRFALRTNSQHKIGFVHFNVYFALRFALTQLFTTLLSIFYVATFFIDKRVMHWWKQNQIIWLIFYALK